MFDTLQKVSEKYAPNDGYGNFVTANREAAAVGILTKPRYKCIVPWKIVAIREKRNRMKNNSLT